jgi:hypothetical protein
VSDPQREYSKRLETYVAFVAAKNRVHIRIGNSKLAVVAVGLVLAWLALAKHALPFYSLLVPIGLYAALAIFHERTIRERARAETAAAFYRRGCARIEDRWAGTGQPGDHFRDDNHVYAGDLDLFGRGCLFELLSTARLPMGENCLAQWLGSPAPKPAVLERQGLVAELRDKLDLHRDLALTGEELRARLNPESLTTWAEGKPAMPPRAWRAVAALLAVATTAAAVYYSLLFIYWPLLTVLMLEIFFRQWLLRRAEAVIEELHCNAEGLVLFSEILQRFEQEPFASPRLQDRKASCRERV